MTRKTSLVLCLATLFAVGCDSDGDGVRNGDDCAPDNADVHPDAGEICDGIDNNCDGTIDEGVTTTFYADADGDGFGGVLAVDACEAPEGFLEDNTDCDDLDAAAYPGAAEVCDDVDNNCDGLVDDADPANDASTGHTFYADGDGDGYGDAASTLDACSTPSGYVDNADDCDDSNGDLNPETNWYGDLDDDGYGDALYVTQSCEPVDGYSLDDGDCDDFDASVSPDADEYCDEIDNNCDGQIDEDSAVDALTWYEDGDEDGYGSEVTAVACYQPDGYVALDGDCDDANAGANPNATEICGDSTDNDCDGTTDYAISVPTDYSTIQAAIDAASDGDGICVEAGTYYENLTFSASVTLAGVGEGTTILDGGGDALVYSFDGDSIALRHMTLQNGYDNNGSVFYGFQGDAAFEDVTLLDVGCADSGSCYGVFLIEEGSLTLTDVTADGLSIDSNGGMYGGFIRAEDADVSVDGFALTNTFMQTGSYGYAYGWFLYGTGSTVDVTNLEVSDNWFNAGYHTYGLFYLTSGSDLTVRESHVDVNLLDSVETNNSDVSYPMLYQSGGSTSSTWENVTFTGNEITASDDVWAWFDFVSSGGTVDMTNVLIADNVTTTLNASSSTGAYGLSYNYYTDVTWTNVDIVNNTWKGFDYVYAVLGYRSYNGDNTLVNVNVANNSADDVDTTYGGLMYASYGNDEGYGSWDWSYSNHYGNWDTFEYDWYDDGSDGDLSAFTGNLTADPLYTDESTGDYTLGTGSPSIDAGDPEILDADGSTSDIGAYGGPQANL